MFLLLRIFAVVGLLLVIACAGATQAQPPKIPPTPDTPVLKPEQVGNLLFTYLYSSLDEVPSECVSAFIAPDGGRGSYAFYMGDNLWLVSWGDFCSYTVSDQTGKVLGP